MRFTTSRMYATRDDFSSKSAYQEKQPAPGEVAFFSAGQCDSPPGGLYVQAGSPAR